MAAATLSESMPSRIGMTARRSADCSQRGDQPVPLGAEHEGEPIDAGDRGVDRDGVSRQRQGDGGEPARGEVRQRVVPVREPGPGVANTAPIATLIARR